VICNIVSPKTEWNNRLTVTLFKLVLFWCWCRTRGESQMYSVYFCRFSFKSLAFSKHCFIFWL